MIPGKVAAYGELLFRITPNPRIFSAEFSLGGAELNVATALATWGVDTAYISRLPENVLSENVEKLVQELGIDTSRMLWGGERIGIYYMQTGGDMQSSSVVYDRKYSAFSEIQPGTIDWDRCLDGITWLHWTAITPALNANAVIVCREILESARKKNIFISTDLNNRRLLWKYGKSPFEVMPDLVQYCDVLMGNIWAASEMLAVNWDENLLIRGDKESCKDMAAQVAEKIMTTFPQCKQVAFTFRFTEPNGHLNYFATLSNYSGLFESINFRKDSVVDSVGSGDSFMAGLIYGMLQNMSSQQLINFAAASAVSKLNIKGDANTTPVNKIEELLTR
ncbi:MAG: sugar kinase [Chitinophagaceae bacterium]